MYLTQSRDPVLLPRIQSEAGDALLEMAAWHPLGQAMPALVILARLAGKVRWLGYAGGPTAVANRPGRRACRLRFSGLLAFAFAQHASNGAGWALALLTPALISSLLYWVLQRFVGLDIAAGSGEAFVFILPSYLAATIAACATVRCRTGHSPPSLIPGPLLPFVRHCRKTSSRGPLHGGFNRSIWVAGPINIYQAKFVRWTRGSRIEPGPVYQGANFTSDTCGGFVTCMRTHPARVALGLAWSAVIVFAQVAATIDVNATQTTPLNAGFSGFNYEAAVPYEPYDPGSSTPWPRSSRRARYGTLPVFRAMRSSGRPG